MSRFQVINQGDKREKNKKSWKYKRQGRRNVPLAEAFVEDSGIASTGRINDGMATFLVRRSSARSFEGTFQSWTALAEATRGAASRGTEVEPAPLAWQQASVENVAFFEAEAIAKDS